MFADKAVLFRARYGLRTPDSIQLATAQVCGADLVITNDRKWEQVRELSVIQVANL